MLLKGRFNAPASPKGIQLGREVAITSASIGVKALIVADALLSVAEDSEVGEGVLGPQKELRLDHRLLFEIASITFASSPRLPRTSTGFGGAQRGLQACVHGREEGGIGIDLVLVPA